MRRYPDPMTLAEAAERSGLAASTLRWQIKNGRLEATKRGRDWLVSRKDLDAYLKSVAERTGA